MNARCVAKAIDAEQGLCFTEINVSKDFWGRAATRHLGFIEWFLSTPANNN